MTAADEPAAVNGPFAIIDQPDMLGISAVGRAVAAGLPLLISQVSVAPLVAFCQRMSVVPSWLRSPVKTGFQPAVEARVRAAMTLPFCMSQNSPRPSALLRHIIS